MTSALKRLALSDDALRFGGFFLLVMLVGALAGPLRALLPVRVEAELGRPPEFSSALQSLLLGGAGIFALIGGALADRLGQKRTLVLGLAHLPLMALVYLARDPVVLLGAALASGLVGGLFTVGGQSYLVAAAPRAYLGVASALYFLGSTLGSSLGSLVAGLVVERQSFGAFGAAALAGSALLQVGAARLLPAVEPGRLSPGRHAERPRLTLSRDLLLVAALRFLPTCFWGAVTLLAPLLLFRLSGSVVAVALYSSVSLAVAAGCQIATGRLFDRVGRGPPVLVLAALVPLAALAMGLAAGSFEALFAAGVLATAVAWSISVSFPPLVRDLAPEGQQGRALGLLHLLWTAGMLIGTLAGGRLVEVDPGLPFLLGAALNLPTALVGLTLWRRQRSRV
ncbi:MAG TPA: MFS transporter [Chloroflexota bacterium]